MPHHKVELSDGTRIETFTLVWTAGTSPHPLVKQLDLPKERQRLRANACLQVEGRPGVWALGDCAIIPDGAGGFQPPTAQHASHEGKVLAHNLVASVRGEPLAKRSGCWLPSAGARGWRVFWGTTSPGSSPGGSGARSTGSSCPAPKRSCGWRSTGPWTSSSQGLWCGPWLWK